ncbi:MAG: hypothetical protein JW881_12075 [Spirochaetales bacterium]|nr:hypothetical protein [Spirochaetales bacterium]
MNIKNAVDKKFESMSMREILKQPVSAIQGVSEGDAAKMKEAFRISTVEQFSKLRFAKWAWAIQELEKTEKEGHGGNASFNIDKAVDKAYEGKTLKQILDSPLEALQGLSERQAALLYDAFKIKKVKQLASQRFFSIARSIYFLALCEDPSSDPNSKL